MTGSIRYADGFVTCFPGSQHLYEVGTSVLLAKLHEGLTQADEPLAA